MSIRFKSSRCVGVTIWVVPITSNLRAPRYPDTMRIDPDDQNGLTTSPVLLVFQLRAIDKRRLLRLAGKISASQPAQVLRVIDLLLGKQP